MPDGQPASAPWHLMNYEFRLKPGAGVAPKPLGSEVSEHA
jgi:hydroxyquinol 1,2-dioxygenase